MLRSPCPWPLHNSPLVAQGARLGGKGGGGGTTTQSSSTTIPPEVLARYNAVNARAEQAAAQPFTPYGGEFVAPVNQTQQGGINTITNSGGTADPYFQQANTQLNQGLGAAQPYFGTAGAQVGAGYNFASPLNNTALTQLNQGLGAAQPLNASAGSSYTGAYSGAQPYQAGATGLALAGTGAVNPGALNIPAYMSPYNDAVVQSTLRLVDQQQQRDRNALNDQGILQGAFGGSGTRIGQAVLQGQQGLARANIASNLYNQNYQQALGAAQQQQGVGLSAGQANRAALQAGAGQLLGIGQQGYQQGMGLGQAQQGLGQQLFTQGLGAAQGYQGLGTGALQQGLSAAQGNLGVGQGVYGLGQNYATTAAGLGTGQLGAQLQQGQAQLGAGTIQQQTQQALDQAKYNQFLQQQGYPFQVAQFLANIAEGTGALSGSTTQSTTNQPTPFFSDERLKEGVREIGRTKDGIPIVSFRYKGSPNTQIGLLAQDVEKKRPHAVGLAAGYKTVDYDAATRTKRASGGGLCPPYEDWQGGAVNDNSAREGLDTGGAPGSIEAIVAAQKAALQAGFPGGVDPAGINAGSVRGVKMPQSGNHAVLKGSTPAMPAPPQPTMQAAVGTLNDATGLGRTAKDVYSAGKDAAGWLSDTYDRLAHGSIDDQIKDWSSYAGSTPSLDSEIENWSNYRRGGGLGQARVMRAGGGLTMFDEAGGYVPEDDGKSPQELLNEQRGMSNGNGTGGLSGGSRGGDSTVKDVMGGLGSLASLAKLGMMFFARGGGVDESRLEKALQRARHAIGSMESGNKYDALGPDTGGDRAYGRYQVMGRNIGPWTQEVTGSAMSPQEFLRNPAVQDRVFDHYFGRAMREHGTPQDAASVWFTGRPLKDVHPTTKDVLGTSVADYVKRFSTMLDDGAGEPLQDRALRLVASNEHPETNAPVEPDVGLTARTLNEVGARRAGGRVGLQVGGVPDTDVIPPLDTENFTPDRLPPASEYPRPGLAAAKPPAEPQLAQAPPPTSQPTPSGLAAAAPPTPPVTVQATPPQNPPQNPPPAPSGLGAAAAPSTAAGTPAAPSAPGFFDKNGWLDRNERPVMTGLTFLGNMLASPSRYLAGSIGTGLAAAAQAYPAWGFKDRALNVSQQNADTQQIGAVQNAMNLIARQREAAVQAAPTADTTPYDQNMTALYGRMLNLLQVRGVNTSVLQSPKWQDYMQQLPGDARSYAMRLHQNDNPWFYQHLLTMATTPDQIERLTRQRDQSVERLRAGQARGLDGTSIVPAEDLTKALLGFKQAEARVSAEGSTEGSLDRAKTELAAAEAAAKAWLSRNATLDPMQKDRWPQQLRNEFDILQRNIETARGKLHTLSGPQPTPVTVRQSGGRIGKADGGSFQTEPPPGVDNPDDWSAKAPEPTPQPKPGEYNDPSFLRRRATLYGGMGLHDEASRLQQHADRLDLERRETGLQTTDKGVTTVPGQAGAVAQREREIGLQGRMPVEAQALAQSGYQKARDEAYNHVQNAIQMTQYAKSIRDQLIDPRTNQPTMTTGPLSNTLSDVGALLRQAGVSSKTISDIMNVNPENVEAVRKTLLSMGSQIARGDINGPVRQQEWLQYINSATPNNQLLSGAIAHIIDDVIMPRAQRDIEGYSKVVKMSPSENVYDALIQYQRENPWYQYRGNASDHTPSGPQTQIPSVPTPLQGLPGLRYSPSTQRFYDAEGRAYTKNGDRVQ